MKARLFEGLTFEGFVAVMYEQHIAFIEGRTGITWFTDLKIYSPHFSIAGGLSFRGWAYLFGGYSLVLGQRDFWDASGFGSSFWFNLYGPSEF